MSCALFDCTRTPCHFGLKILDLARHALFLQSMIEPHPIFVDRVPCATGRTLLRCGRCCVCCRADVWPQLLRLQSVHHEGQVYEVCQICDLSARVQELATCGAASADGLLFVERRLRELRRLLEEDSRSYRQQQWRHQQRDGGHWMTSTSTRGPGGATGSPAGSCSGSWLPRSERGYRPW